MRRTTSGDHEDNGDGLLLAAVAQSRLRTRACAPVDEITVGAVIAREDHFFFDDRELQRGQIGKREYQAVCKPKCALMASASCDRDHKDIRARASGTLMFAEPLLSGDQNAHTCGSLANLLRNNYDQLLECGVA